MSAQSERFRANVARDRALASMREAEDAYVRALEEKGVTFEQRGVEDERIAQLRQQLEGAGALMRNAGASISYGWLSPACVECTGTGGSETFSTSFKCHRDCYFCFNYNLPDYERYVREGCPWERELADAHDKTRGKLAVIGLTGGEPLLNLDDSVRFLKRARELFPHAHLRMYTSGDLLTEEGARRLRDAGLCEIRFSVKQDDTDALHERVLDRMALARRFIPDVVVEMPIVPGTEDEMHALMVRFDEIGITGMNLLEFCFPFHSWVEFEKRGFKLKNPPFPVMYDYGYSGGLAVAGSEELALSLMLDGIREGYGFGMHYCSLENKHRSEMRQRNGFVGTDNPCFTFDEGDFFIQCARVFGEDRARARQALEQAGCTTLLEDDDEDSTSFPRAYAQVAGGVGAEVWDAFFVAERDDEGGWLREVGVFPTSA
jgi:pyruvate formate-lyase activating enzyme-like uncharacterized protein